MAGTIQKSDSLKLQEQLKEYGIPFVNVQYSNLGGNKNASLIVKISLDSKETWINGIYHNSRYSMFHVTWNRDKEKFTIEQFSRHFNLLNFRKNSRVKSLMDVADKILYYAQSQNMEVN